MRKSLTTQCHFIVVLAHHGCVVAALKRDERLVVTNGSTRLRAGDELTFIGSEPAVNAAREKLDGTN